MTLSSTASEESNPNKNPKNPQASHLVSSFPNAQCLASTLSYISFVLQHPQYLISSHEHLRHATNATSQVAQVAQSPNGSERALDARPLKLHAAASAPAEHPLYAHGQPDAETGEQLGESAACDQGHDDKHEYLHGVLLHEVD